jgi:2-C-methyl-D-erythritol 4-phosphate cytidylyltransferase
MLAKAACILVCAGSSSRMGDLGTVKSKVLIELDKNWFVLHEVLDRIQKAGVRDLVLVCPNESTLEFKSVLNSFSALNSSIASGGTTRSESVLNGLNVIRKLETANPFEVIFVHDGARPFFSSELLREGIFLATNNQRGYVLGVPVVNTIKVCNRDLSISNTLDRDTLWEVQTPQIFPAHFIKESYDKFEFSETIFDDSMLLERAGYPVSILKSDSSNFKITTQVDTERAILYYHSLKADLA